MRYGPLVSLVALACASGGCAREPLARNALEPAAVHAELLRGIAAQYESWDRIDNGLRWAPENCMLRPGVGRISTARAAHGGKLYYLFARDRADYVDAERGDAPVGQTIVKEAWSPVAAAGANPDPFDPHGRPFAERDGERFAAGERVGLFVMHKLEPTRPDTDRGWIYATISADGSEVLQAGRLDACMACHARGTVDRLYGPMP